MWLLSVATPCAAVSVATPCAACACCHSLCSMCLLPLPVHMLYTHILFHVESVAIAQGVATGTCSTGSGNRHHHHHHKKKAMKLIWSWDNGEYVCFGPTCAGIDTEGEG